MRQKDIRWCNEWPLNFHIRVYSSNCFYTVIFLSARIQKKTKLIQHFIKYVETYLMRKRYDIS